MPRGGNNWGPSIHRGPYQGDNDKGCWLWTGRMVGRYGYGKVTVGGRVKRAHREVFQAIYGWDPPEVRHRCDEPSCWRPDHLEGGTSADNGADMVERGRQSRGSQRHNAVLSEEIVAKARRLNREDPHRWCIPELAERYGTDAFTMRLAVTGRSWRHVDEPVGLAPRVRRFARRATTAAPGPSTEEAAS